MSGDSDELSYGDYMYAYSICVSCVGWVGCMHAYVQYYLQTQHFIISTE